MYRLVVQRAEYVLERATHFSGCLQEEHMQMKAEEERKRALQKKRKQQLCARNRSIRQQKRAAREAHEAKELACEERALVQCCDELARMQMMEDAVHDAAAVRCLQRPSLVPLSRASLVPLSSTPLSCPSLGPLSCLVSQVCWIVHSPRDCVALL